MMESTKIQLSEEELDLMQNTSFILTKNSIINKVSEALHSLGSQWQQQVQADGPGIPEEVLRSFFKVSKGEKYKGLPYVILDYPRIFSREEVLAIRTMFWWGNYYSVTLHVKGKYVKHITGNLLDYMDSHPGMDVYVSTDGDEWNHDLHVEYRKLSEVFPIKNTTMSSNISFLKLTTRVQLGAWEMVEEKLKESFRLFFQFIRF